LYPSSWLRVALVASYVQWPHRVVCGVSGIGQQGIPRRLPW
jgi:hypothetical protein